MRTYARLKCCDTTKGNGWLTGNTNLNVNVSVTFLSQKLFGLCENRYLFRIHRNCGLGNPWRSPSNLMLRLPYRQLGIRIDNDPSYSFGSVDNPRGYDHAYRLDNERYSPSSLHAVRIFQEDDNVFASCILGASGGASGVHDHSAIVHADSLLIAVGPFVASLQLPTLTLNWKVQTDWATCFGDCYISHGEVDVACVSYDGTIMWSNSGADIFTKGFSVAQNRVTAIDWNDDKYVWNIATGKLIESTVNKAQNPGGGF
jgi:hypothetical protein